MKILYATVILLILILAVSNEALPQPGNLRASIKLSKNVYLKGEPILVSTSIMNIGSDTLRVSKKIHFEIKDASGKVFPPESGPVRTGDGIRPDFLPPHDTISHTWDMLYTYAPGNPLRTESHANHFEPNQYTVQAVFESESAKIFSQVLSFTVAEPKGKDRTAYDLLVRASNYWVQDRREEAGCVLDSLIRMYPKSPYYDFASYKNFNIYEYSNKETEQKLGYKAAMSVIESNPESDVANTALTYILIRTHKVLKSPKDEKEFLEQLVHKLPNTKIGKRAMKALQNK